MELSMKDKIFVQLVIEGKQKTAAQLAAQYKTTRAAVAARISEIRDEGYSIYANKRKDTKGRVKVFYRFGTPTRSVVTAGRFMQKVFG